MRAKRGRDGTPSEHPTRLLLVEVAAGLVAERGVDGVFLDDVVERACLSRGAVYHHFADFADLVEAAVAARYVTVAQRWLAELAAALEEASCPADLAGVADRLTGAVLAPELRRERMLQVRALALAEQSRRFETVFEPHVVRVTGDTAALLADARDRGVLHPDTDPEPLAALLVCLLSGLAVTDLHAAADGFGAAVSVGVRSLFGVDRRAG